MTDQELDDFIDEAERRAVDEWWIIEFCEEAAVVGKELKKLRQEKHEMVTRDHIHKDPTGFNR